MYVMDQSSKWEDYIHLVEFAYNNGYQDSLKMSPFESLYGRKCYTPVSWYNLVDKAIIGLDLLKEMEEKMVKIKHNSNVSEDRKKHYANNNIAFIDFKVGEHVFLKVKVKISSLGLRIFPKLEVIYYGPCEILEKLGPFSYMLSFSASMRVHNVFHVSLLNKYVPYPNNIIDWNVI
jgi:hypothetical protein